MPVKSVTSLPHTPRPDDVYAFLHSRGSANLYVDVGAASGEISARIAPDTAELLAFEPFPHNADVFRQRFQQYPHVRLIGKAVSNRRGRTTFFVDSTVQGDEPGWTEHVGYSSIGRIEPSLVGTLKSYLSVGLAALRRRRGATMLRVETTTLDSELGGRVVDFLKIDVQGAERQVLAGASSALEHQRIRLVYAEWSGDPEVENRLAIAGYTVFDSMYIGSSSNSARSAFVQNGFEVLGSVPLSVGQPALEMAYRGSDPDIGAVLRRLTGHGHFIQTDLVALPASHASEYQDFLGTRGRG